jgi:hypothetical protein
MSARYAWREAKRSADQAAGHFDLVVNLSTAKAIGLSIPEPFCCAPMRSSNEPTKALPVTDLLQFGMLPALGPGRCDIACAADSKNTSEAYICLR